MNEQLKAMITEEELQSDFNYYEANRFKFTTENETITSKFDECKNAYNVVIETLRKNTPQIKARVFDRDNCDDYIYLFKRLKR